MTTATIHLSEELKARAERSAGDRGLTLDEFVEETLEARLRDLRADKGPEPANRRTADSDYQQDPLFKFSVYDGPAPADGAERHDDYLYGDES